MSEPILLDCRLNAWGDKETKILSILSQRESEIARTIFDTGIACYTKGLPSRRLWTDDIQKTLEKLAVGYGLLPFPNQLKGAWERGGEWLFDHCWVEARSEGLGLDWRMTKSLVLACESEWNTDEYAILEDFLKLTFSNASIRLFIYTVPKSAQAVVAAEICKNCMTAKDGRYLLLGFPDDDKTGQFRLDAWGKRADMPSEN